MLKAVIFTLLLVCVALVYARDATKEHQLESLEPHKAEQKHSRHKEHTKNTLSNTEHGAKHHMQHGKVKTPGHAPRRVRKPQREEGKKRNEGTVKRDERKEHRKKGEGKVKHAGAGETKTTGHKRKQSKHVR